MDLASLSDYEKFQKEGVITVESGNNTAYLKIAGPLNFNIVEAMSNTDVEDTKRAVDCLMACLCDKDGLPLFEMHNQKHRALVQGLDIDLQMKILDTILNYFGLKKKG
jgi:hypothetical protein